MFQQSFTPRVDIKNPKANKTQKKNTRFQDRWRSPLPLVTSRRPTELTPWMSCWFDETCWLINHEGVVTWWKDVYVWKKTESAGWKIGIKFEILVVDLHFKIIQRFCSQLLHQKAHQQCPLIRIDPFIICLLTRTKMYRNHKANSCYYHEPFTSCICETFLLGHIKIYKNHVGSGPQSPVSSDMNIYIYNQWNGTDRDKTDKQGLGRRLLESLKGVPFRML